jgi:hypothetical protein
MPSCFRNLDDIENARIDVLYGYVLIKHFDLGKDIADALSLLIDEVSLMNLGQMADLLFERYFQETSAAHCLAAGPELA